MGIGAAIVTGIGAVVSTVTSVVGTVVSTAGDILDATGVAQLVSVIGTITGSIDKLVNGIGDILHGIAGPIKDLVGGIGSLTNDIQDKIIGPILGPIADTVKGIHDLTKTIGKLVDQGITGILQIPKAITDALGGIEASWDRATQHLADSQGHLIKESLVPGIHKAIAPGLEAMGAAFLKFSSPGTLDPDQLTPIDLRSTLKHDGFTDLAKWITDHGKNPQQWYDWLFTTFYYIVLYSLQAPATLEPILEEARAEARKANPTTTFDVGTILALWTRGIIQRGSATEELSLLGYEGSRISALLESVLWLPDIGRSMDWWSRGIINDHALEHTLKAQGLITDDITALKKANEVLIPPTVLLDWLARGFIKQVDFDDQLRAQGYTEARIKNLLQGGIAPISVDAAIASQGNRLAGLDNWFASTYLSKPPDEVTNAAEGARMDRDEATLRWQAHFNAMPLQMAITLFQRGDLTRHELEIVLAQSNYPPDMVDYFIAAYAQFISPRSIPQLLQQGDLSPGAALHKLLLRGYTQEDANLIVDSAVSKAKRTTKGKETEKSKLTTQELTSAYKDGLIDESEYRAMLSQHGLLDHDIDITIALEKFALAKAHKADEIATIKAEVALGVITLQEASDQLMALGLTPRELEKVRLAIQHTKRQGAKIPDLSILTRMAKKGLLDPTQLLAGVQALGYQNPWDKLLVALELGVDQNAG